MARGSRLQLLAAALVVGFGALTQAYYWPQISDDAFVFFRYADHVAAGAGPAWNVGEPAVEGYSSPLWLAILAAASWFGAATPLAAKVLGVAAWALTAAGGYVLARDLANSRAAGLLALAVIVTSRPLQYWAPSGMETSLHAMLVVWTIVLLTKRQGLVGVAVLGLVGVTRPDGPLFVAVVAGSFAATRPRREWLPILAIAAAPATLYEAFRLAYFGEWFPNTYYAKVGGSLVSRLVLGAKYGWAGLVAGLGVVLLCTDRWMRRRLRRSSPRQSTALALSSAAVLALLFPVVWSGGDWMWHHRFLCPVLPVIAASVIGAAWSPGRAFFADAPEALPGGAGPVLICGAAVLMGVIGFTASGLVSPIETLSVLRGDRLPPARVQEGTMTDISRDVAEYLRRHASPEDKVAVNHAGALPYYSDLQTIDMTGLNDHHIAHESGGGLHEKFDTAYVLAKRPRYVVLNTRVEPTGDAASGDTWYTPGYWVGETSISQHPDFRAHYEFVPRFWRWTWFTRDNFIVLAERRRD